MKKKIFYGLLLFLIIILLVNLSFIYFTKSDKQKSSIQTNKKFIIESNFNRANNQFSFNTENSLKPTVEKINNNISLIIYNINNINPEDLSKLLDLQSNIRLGFDFLNEDILKKSSYFGHNALLKLNFDPNSPLINNNNENKIIINPNYSIEENKENFTKLEQIAKQYNLNFYINENDIVLLGYNKEFLYKLSLMQPFVIKNNNKCNEINHICFFNKTMNEEEVNKNFEEILNKSQNEKWLIFIEYKPEIDKLVKDLVGKQNYGALELKK